MDYFGRTQQAKNKTEEAQAREKLELVLLDLQTDKAVDPTYNEKEYIDNKIKENGMIVSGNIVFVNGYQFQIDRSVPKIGVSIGKGEEDSQIEITMTSTTSSDFVKATIHIEIEYEQDIKMIIFDGENLEIPQKQDGKYVIEKEVNKNSTYNVIAKNSEDKYNIASITITDISEDMNIYTAEDLAAFRDKVNNGATFEGKTIKLMNNLDLKDVCGADTKNWEPIGNETTPFKGTFEGNKHTIDNLYINNSTSDYQGLFGVISSGKIQNLCVSGNVIGNMRAGGVIGAIKDGNDIEVINCKSNINIEGTSLQVGGVVGFIYNCTDVEVLRCRSDGTITGNADVGGIVGTVEQSNNIRCYQCCNFANISTKTSWAGGIVGMAQYGSILDIEECYNKAETIETGDYASGGITGGAYGDVVIHVIHCYNVGNINSLKGSLGGIVGNLEKNESGNPTIEIKNCYNVGDIQNNGIYGGIVGYYVEGSKLTTENNYWLLSCGATFGIGTGSNDGATLITSENLKKGASTLGNVFIEDSTHINNDYPILKWQNSTN